MDYQRLQPTCATPACSAMKSEGLRPFTWSCCNSPAISTTAIEIPLANLLCTQRRLLNNVRPLIPVSWFPRRQGSAIRHRRSIDSVSLPMLFFRCACSLILASCGLHSDLPLRAIITPRPSDLVSHAINNLASFSWGLLVYGRGLFCSSCIIFFYCKKDEIRTVLKAFVPG